MAIKKCFASEVRHDDECSLMLFGYPRRGRELLDLHNLLCGDKYSSKRLMWCVVAQNSVNMLPSTSVN